MVSLRLQEMHPAIVHAPIVLLPLAVGADLVGYAANDQSLLSFGQKAIFAAAIGGIAAVVTGLIAGEEVNVEGKSRDMLMTHRNLNVAAAVIASGLAIWRSRRKRPSAAYLGLGAAGVGVLGYTAYLGGKLVYDDGVGVAPAKGVYRPDAPRLGKGDTGAFFKDAATDLGHGVEHMVEEVSKGLIIPAIVGGSGKEAAPPPEVEPAPAPEGQPAT
jgi:uncharacterized membrane protein